MADRVSRKKIEDRLMEITGHTSDLNEALSQWEAERQALAELFDLTQAQDIIIRKFKASWAEFAKLMWGKTMVPNVGVDVSEKAMHKRKEVGERLNNLAGIAQDNIRATTKAVNKVRQLPLFDERVMKKRGKDAK